MCWTTSLVNTEPSGVRALDERGLPRDPCQGGELGARSPTLNLSQNTGTKDHCLPNAAPDNGLSDEPPAVCTVEIFFVWILITFDLVLIERAQHAFV